MTAFALLQSDRVPLPIGQRPVLSPGFTDLLSAQVGCEWKGLPIDRLDWCLEALDVATRRTRGQVPVCAVFRIGHRHHLARPPRPRLVGLSEARIDPLTSSVGPRLIPTGTDADACSERPAGDDAGESDGGGRIELIDQPENVVGSTFGDEIGGTTPVEQSV